MRSDATAGDSSASSGDVGGEAISEDVLTRGLMLGRYVILDRIGDGGMGIVYAAYDPELDRRVAVKLLRSDLRIDPAARSERILKEAKALARLSHPNVVAVHDVGSFRGQVFVAMELIDGQTLKAWCAERRRSWREIRDVYLAAGRGLAAAHAVGLVHRDFKPDNVLLDKSGRVRVTDFGLALELEAPRDQPGAASAARRPPGTRGYIAPESESEARVDARADQFSFSVSLYQSLYGELPFDPDDATRTLRAPPQNARVPGWLRRVLLRGLAMEPEKRFANLDELLHELQRDPARTRRRWAGALAALAATVMISAGVRDLSTRVQRECAAAGSRVHQLWSEGRRAEIRAALEGGLANGAATWARLGPALDAHATKLAQAKISACEATRVHQRESEEAYAHRRACLERRRIELDALTRLLAEGDREVLSRAEEATQLVLLPLSACDHVPPARRLVTTEDVSALRSRLAEARVLRVAGHYRRGRELAGSVAKEAAALQSRTLQAEALVTLSALKDEAGDFSGAEQSLREAVHAAEAAGDDEVLATAWIDLVAALGYRQDRDEEAFVSERHARALLERLGSSDKLEADLLNNVGRVLQRQGRHREALQHFESSLELRRKYRGEEHVEVAASLNNVGLVLSHLGRPREALGRYREAMDIVRDVLGPEHPEMAVLEQNLGGTLYRAGDLEGARDAFARARALNEKTLGADHPRAATSASNLSMTLARLGQLDEAITLERAALSARERAHGSEHLDVARSQADLAVLLLRAGRLEEAETLAARSLAVRERALGGEDPLVAASLTYLAAAHLAQDRPAEARREYERALDILERSLGPNRVELVEDLVGIGRAWLAERKPTRAIPALERAEALRTVGGEGPLFTAASFELARALWAAGGDRTRACELARRAREEFGSGEGVAINAASVDGFLVRCEPRGAVR